MCGASPNERVVIYTNHCPNVSVQEAVSVSGSMARPWVPCCRDVYHKVLWQVEAFSVSVLPSVCLGCFLFVTACVLSRDWWVLWLPCCARVRAQVLFLFPIVSSLISVRKLWGTERANAPVPSASTSFLSSKQYICSVTWHMLCHFYKRKLQLRYLRNPSVSYCDVI